MIGALCASGVPPWFMVAHSRGEVFEGVVDADGRPAAEADRAGGARFELERALPPIGPGSWRLALRTLANPRRFTPATVVSGWMPRGIFSTESLKDTIRRVVPSGWSPHPNLWVVACDYETGRRVPFGRAGAPEADLADAVAASCAIPGIYHPADDRRPPLRRRRHLLDLESSTCSATRTSTSSSASTRPPPCTRSGRSTRATRLNLALPNAPPAGASAARPRSSAPRGTEVVLIQPTGEDLEAMGPNLMSPRRRNQVIEVARRTVAEQLASRANRELLADLPAGRPAQGPPPRRPALGVAGPRRAPAGRRPARMNESRRHRVVVIGGGSAASTQAEARAR